MAQKVTFFATTLYRKYIRDSKILFSLTKNVQYVVLRGGVEGEMVLGVRGLKC